MSPYGVQRVGKVLVVGRHTEGASGVTIPETLNVEVSDKDPDCFDT